MEILEQCCFTFIFVFSCFCGGTILQKKRKRAETTIFGGEWTIRETWQ